MATLRTDYQNDILADSMNGKRRYQMTQNADGTVSFTDTTTYAQTGSTFAASELNSTNAEVNSIMRVVVSDTAPSDKTVLWIKPETD